MKNVPGTREEVFVPYDRVFEVKEHLSRSEVKYVVSEVHCDHQVVTTAECYHDQYAFAPVVSCSMTRPFMVNHWLFPPPLVHGPCGCSGSHQPLICGWLRGELSQLQLAME